MMVTVLYSTIRSFTWAATWATPTGTNIKTFRSLLWARLAERWRQAVTSRFLLTWSAPPTFYWPSSTSLGSTKTASETAPTCSRSKGEISLGGMPICARLVKYSCGETVILQQPAKPLTTLDGRWYQFECSSASGAAIDCLSLDGSIPCD